MATGTVTVTERTIGRIHLVKWSCTTTAGGAASDVTTKTYSGKIVGLATDPGATAPTDDWDLTITDDNSLDVLLGAGANRDTANTEYVVSASLGGVAHSKLTANVTNGGNAKVMDIYLYIDTGNGGGAW